MKGFHRNRGPLPSVCRDPQWHETNLPTASPRTVDRLPDGRVRAAASWLAPGSIQYLRSRGEPELRIDVAMAAQPTKQLAPVSVTDPDSGKAPGLCKSRPSGGPHWLMLPHRSKRQPPPQRLFVPRTRCRRRINPRGHGLLRGHRPGPATGYPGRIQLPRRHGDVATASAVTAPPPRRRDAGDSNAGGGSSCNQGCSPLFGPSWVLPREDRQRTSRDSTR